MYGYNREKTIKKIFSGMTASILVFVLLFVLFLFAVGSISKDSVDSQEENLNTALHRSIVSCYCVEGTYPPSLDYIKQHYGLMYDENLFFVDYISEGSNIYPDVTVIRKADGDGK